MNTGSEFYRVYVDETRESAKAKYRARYGCDPERTETEEVAGVVYWWLGPVEGARHGMLDVERCLAQAET